MDSKNKEKDHIAPQSLSLKFAETLYRRKMNKVSAKPNFIEIQDLLERHEYSIQYALEITAEAEALTASKKQEIKNLLEQLYFYYREINLKKRETPGPAIGIDLGTTNCCVAVYQLHNNDHSGPAGSSTGSASASAGNIRIIHNDMGFDKTPSQVAFPTDQDQPIYGETAKMLAYQNPQNTIYSVKRMIGRKFEHIRQQNQETFWPFTIIKNPDNGEIKVQIYDKNKCPRNAYAPEEISSLLIKYLKESAEDALGMPVLSAVVAVPAYFNAYQRDLTKAACQKAGLNVLQLINEPTAAAVAYSVHKRGSGQGENINSVKSHRNCLIFDLGGGTFDVAVLTIKNDQLFIKAIGGDAQLGGEDFDNNMVSYCVREFQKEHGIDLTEGKSSCDTLEKFKSSKSLRRLKIECEKQKQCLSKVRKTAVSVEAIHDNLDLTVEFTVAKLEELNMELFERCITIVEDVLQKSMLKKEDIHDIILAGGSTRIPKIQQMISEFFPGAKLNKEINPDDAIATGAALLAFYAENPEVPNILIREPEYLQVDIPEDNNNNNDDVDDTHLDGNTSDLPSEIMDSKKPPEFTSKIGQRYSFHSKTDNTLDFGLDTRLSGAEDSPPSTLTTLNQSTTQSTTTDENAENLKVPLNPSNQNQTEGKTKQQIMDELSVTVLLRQDTSNIMDEMQIKSEIHGYLERKSYQPGFSTFELTYVALHDKILYFFKTEEDFWANDAGATRVDIRKSSFEIKDYRGSKRSFLLNVSDGTQFLFLVKNESLLKDWVRHLERNSAVRIQNPIDDDFVPLENVLESTDEVDKETGNEIPENTLQTDQIDEDSNQQNNTQEKKLSGTGTGKIQIHGFLQKKNLLIQSKVVRLSKFQTFYVSLQGKYLYLFPTKEEFLANADNEDVFKIHIHKCSCEIRDYLGSKSSFILKVQNSSSEYLFLAEDSTLVDSWVRKIEKNSAVRLVNQFITQKPSNVAEFIRALQKKLDTN